MERRFGPCGQKIVLRIESTNGTTMTSAIEAVLKIFNRYETPKPGQVIEGKFWMVEVLKDNVEPPRLKMNTIAKKVVKIATAEVGVHEVDDTNCGPRVDEYKAATVLPPHEPWPWCAAFVDWCVREAMKVDGPYTFTRPTTAGAFALINWSLAQDDSTNTKKYPGMDIKSGDIIVFTFSHTGFATSAPDEDGDFHTVEGNTNTAGIRDGGGVYTKVRNISKVRARIRFTV